MTSAASLKAACLERNKNMYIRRAEEHDADGVLKQRMQKQTQKQKKKQTQKQKKKQTQKQAQKQTQ